MGIEESEIKKFFDAISKADYRTVSLLIEENPLLISCRNDFGFTPLHLVASQGIDTVKEHSNITSLLISLGADVNATSSLGWTPLHCIAINGSIESFDVAKILLENNANPNAKNTSGSTPMMMWQHGNEIKELFIKYGASRQR